MQVWHYDDGLTMNIGTGHSGSVAAVRISPDRKIIVSVGSEGGIFIWRMPPRSQDAAHVYGGGGGGGGVGVAPAAGGGCTAEAAASDASRNIDNLADDVSRVSMSR